MKLNWHFLGGMGVQNKKPSVVGVWISSGTEQFEQQFFWLGNGYFFVTQYSNKVFNKYRTVIKLWRIQQYKKSSQS